MAGKNVADKNVLLRELYQKTVENQPEAVKRIWKELIANFPEAEAEGEQKKRDGRRVYLLKQVRFYASCEGKSAEKDLQKMIDELLKLDPKAELKIKQQRTVGEFLRKKYAEAFQAGQHREKQKLNALKLEVRARCGEDSEVEFQKLGESYKKGERCEFLLKWIRIYASWGENGKAKLKQAVDELLKLDPSAASSIDQICGIGDFLKECYEKAYQAGCNNQIETLKALRIEVEDRCVGNVEIELQKLEDNYNRGKLMNQRAAEKSTQGQNIGALSPVQPFVETLESADQNTRELPLGLHPNALRSLKPASSWTILMDETGSCFDSTVQNVKSQQRGKLVAVLVPKGKTLQDIPGFHAVDSSQEEIEDVVDSLIKSNCGVLGIPVESLAAANCSELWISCIEDLMELIVRLLPLRGATTLDLQVEQRGNFTSGQSSLLQKTCDDVLHHLSRVFPESAKKITINAKFIGKEDHPWNGYADAAAFLWGSPAQKTALAKTGWLDTCLLGTKPEILRNTLDVLGRMQKLEPEEWNTLVMDPAAGNPNSMVSALLGLIGNEARENRELWMEYLQYVQRHLYSKAINLYQLGRQTNWLAKYIPEDQQLTPRLRLIWLTTQLAEANHHGEIDLLPRIRKEFEKLCNQLYFEDARLTCLACLHVAVAFTDEFQFSEACRVMNYWKDVPMEVPGRQFYGQIRSTYGQLAAFTGKNDEAIALFEEALKEFLKLSDWEQARGDSIQTRAYQLIAMMDSESVSRSVLNRKMEVYFGTTLPEAVDILAVSSEPAFKYAHHVLLRYLLYCGSDELRERYLARKDQWQHGVGHPWELIEFYRALLIPDAAERCQLLRKASELVRESGATLKLISCVILGGLYFEDASCRDELELLTEEVIVMLPKLGAQRIRTLRRQLDKPQEPLELAKAVLPFNFR